MTQALVRRAFEAPLATWAAAKTPPIPIAWEGVKFAPPTDGTRYASAFLLPATTTSDDIAGTHRAYRGVFQVSLYMPQNVGAGDGEALAQELDALYPLTAPLFISGLRVWLITPMSSAQAFPSSDRMLLPVSCSYEAHYIT